MSARGSAAGCRGTDGRFVGVNVPDRAFARPKGRADPRRVHVISVSHEGRVRSTAFGPVCELLQCGGRGDRAMRRLATLVAVATVVGLGGRAEAFHRQTPPIVELTNSGDNTEILPRVHPEFFSPL